MITSERLQTIAVGDLALTYHKFLILANDTDYSYERLQQDTPLSFLWHSLIRTQVPFVHIFLGSYR